MEKWFARYLRLSKEDGDLVDESNSITNQRYIIQNYIDVHVELKKYQIREYMDDGYSGKNFERPDMQKLLQDIRDEKIIGVIVKDFSRFARDHIELGDYIEKIFPLLDIRFISVNNAYDSNQYIGTSPDMDIAFENLIYDYYSEENSVKIKNDLFKQRSRGSYMATFAPFGYQKSAGDKHKLVVDKEASKTVELIFKLYDKYHIKAEVARCLNEQKILTPQEYAKSTGKKYNWKYHNEKKLWNSSIVGRIIRNQIYIGNTTFHKKEVLEVGSKKTKCLSKNEWVVCENTHEAIIDKTLFVLVNETDFERREDSDEKEKRLDNNIYCEGEKRLKSVIDSPIKGYVKCGGCRHSLVRRNRRNASYYCRHYYEIKCEDCYSANIKESILIEFVMVTLQKQAELVADLEKLYDCQQEQKKQNQEYMDMERNNVLKQIEKLQSTNFNLYEKYCREEITREEMIQKKEHNNKLIVQLEELLKKLVTETDEQDKDDGIFQAYGQFKLKDQLTREMVESLISGIYVYNDNRIEIILNYQDELEMLVKSTVCESDRKIN